MSGPGQRSMGLPEANVPAAYSANDSAPKPVRVLPGTACRVYVEREVERFVIGRRMGELKFGELAFSRAEWAELIVRMREAIAAEKKEAK